MKQTAIAVVALFTLAAAFADTRVKEDFQKSFPMQPGGRLTVASFNGPVEITGWEQNTVEVTGTKTAETAADLAAIKVEMNASGNSLSVRAIHPEGLRNAGVRFVIKAPKRVVIDSVATSNGPVRLASLAGDAKVRTSNGPVEIRDVDGEVSVQTSNGPVKAEAVRGAFDVKTSNGPVDVRLTEAPKRDLRVATSNGPIVLRMPGTASARVRAVTSSHGMVTSDFEIGGTTRAHSKLEGAIGSGGPLVELTTSNGPIRLARN